MRSEDQQSRILLVDDEINIVTSIKRLLRNENFQIEIAESGEKALELLEKSAFDLIISDARMPGMDGPTLLAKVEAKWPDCMRILLTGYADITMTVKAINEGRIYRYISKPWNDDDLKIMIRQALDYRNIEQERKQLLILTKEQNQHLTELNETLERRVLDRTAELKQTADWLDLAYADLKKNYVTTTQVFSSLLNLRIEKDRQTNNQVLSVVKKFTEVQGFSEKDCSDFTMAATLYNVGKLTWEDQLISQPTDLLRERDKAKYMKYPEVGASLLMTLEPLHEAARIIRHHQERWDGIGFPDRLSGNDIPLGSRLLKMAVDFIELQKGIFLNRKLGREEALSIIRNYAGRIYDPHLSPIFVDICRSYAPDLPQAGPGALVLDTRRLEPGMVIASNLYADNGMLLLNEGKELTDELIDRLRKFENNENSIYVVVVFPSESIAV